MEEDKLLIQPLCRARKPGVMLKRNMNQDLSPANAQTDDQPCVLVLAAGRGERFLASGGGTHKLEAKLGDLSVLETTLAAVKASGLPWHVELGPEEIKQFEESDEARRPATQAGNNTNNGRAHDVGRNQEKY